jgi:hypothetical protein
MIINKKELISFIFFIILEKKLIEMVILIFRGNKYENPKIFLKEYKRICISIGFKIVVKWFNLFF